MRHRTTYLPPAMQHKVSIKLISRSNAFSTQSNIDTEWSQVDLKSKRNNMKSRSQAHGPPMLRIHWMYHPLRIHCWFVASCFIDVTFSLSRHRFSNVVPYFAAVCCLLVPMFLRCFLYCGLQFVSESHCCCVVSLLPCWCFPCLPFRYSLLQYVGLVCAPLVSALFVHVVVSILLARFDARFMVSV